MHEHTPSILDLRWFWLNFIIYVSLLYIFLRGRLSQGWHQRHRRVLEAVKLGEQSIQAADEELRHAEILVTKIDTDVKRLTTEIEHETAEESQTILAEAKKKAERIALQAADTIASERRAVELSIQREIADLVLKKSEERLQRELDANTDAALRNAAIGGLKEFLQ